MYALYLARQAYRIIAGNLLILFSGQLALQTQPSTENGDGRYLSGLVACSLPFTC